MEYSRFHSTRYWAVVPAAGTGRRMGSETPKQYLPLAGRPVIEHTLRRLAAHPAISGIVVAVREEDHFWTELQPTLELSVPLHAVHGGVERCHSVLNALEALALLSDSEDWVLVHDAARPCLTQNDISRLIEALREHPAGGLLGTPVSDTVKQIGGTGEIAATVDREHLWRALTPQMFRRKALHDALQGALSAGLLVTDDASAMELAGWAPRMVEGRADNIKITSPGDLALAEFYLARQEDENR